MKNKYRAAGFLWAAFVTAADQVTKVIARGSLLEGISKDLMGETVRFTLRYNYGAAFSLGWGGPVFLSVFTVIACIFLVRYMLKVEPGLKTVWLGVILGGAAGNLFDRLYMGKVTDFIDIGLSMGRWPTFNVADIAICIGGIAVFMLLRKTERLEVSSED